MVAFHFVCRLRKSIEDLGVERTATDQAFAELNVVILITILMTGFCCAAAVRDRQEGRRLTSG
jgi:hypothetical protein